MLCDDGLAYWVDGAGAARTTRLHELAPSPRVLDRILHSERDLEGFRIRDPPLGDP